MLTTTNTTIHCRLESGETAVLTVADCCQIINAMARRHLLDVAVESIPADYSELWTDDVCAVHNDESDGDAVVILFANAADFNCATPRSAGPAKKKAAKKK